jgi:hypothetical protein
VALVSSDPAYLGLVDSWAGISARALPWIPFTLGSVVNWAGYGR